jgi:hypothetical protein
MTPRRLAPLPAAILVTCAAFAVATPLLTTVVTDTRDTIVYVHPVVAGLTSLLMLTWAIVGALVATRFPRNPIGWLFLTVAVVFSVGLPLDLHGSGVTSTGVHLPGRGWAAWGASALLQNPAVFGLFGLILLLFPDGRPRTPRWRPIVRTVGAAVVGFWTVLLFKPGPVAESHPPVDNPAGLAPFELVWDLTELPLLFVILACTVAGIACIVTRFRHAAGVERQQMKWLAAGAGGLVLTILSGPLYFWRAEDLHPAAWQLTFVAALTLLPTTAGVGMLRYRLFDIDRIVSRTLAYAIVVGLMGAVYVSVILAFRALAGPVLGNGDLPIAVSTLAAAAAFQPVHRRVRGGVDRRFNRRRYDAGVAVAGFGSRIRDELDPATARSELEALVRSTLEPTTVRLTLLR